MRGTRRRTHAVGSSSVLGAGLGVAVQFLLCLPAVAALSRPADPVVLTGAEVPALAGIPPGDLVAFRYGAAWQQIPVQVDERAPVDLGTVYDSAPIGVVVLCYTDPDTYTGADPDSTLDDDDEIAFMAKDAGDRPAVFLEPAGVVAGSGVEVAITDPLDAGASGYVYLFRQTGALDPSAGAQYVTYGFNLLSGPYLTTYNLQTGPNPEDSTVTTSCYGHHFADRWIDDELHIYAGAASGADILDRHKNLFAPGNCVRSEDTFSNGEGAFVVNKSGPVRAIRSYLGANSGPLTQREHLFYECRHDMATFLRVHAISGCMDFFDYSPAASGMEYHNDFNTSGVTIDGVEDTVTAGAITWEMVNGPQGGLVIVHTLSSSIAGFDYTSYYLDSSSPSVTQCTGDAFAYGSSGLWVNQSIPCTDPALDCTDHLVTRRSLYYEAPGLTVADALDRRDQIAHPLALAFTPWQDLCPVEASRAFGAGWNMMAVTIAPTDPDPAVVFAGIGISGNLYRYQAGGYVAYWDSDPGSFGDVELGDGYWLYLDAPAAVDHTGCPAAGTVAVPLPSQGWHLIGHTHQDDQLLADCEVRDTVTEEVRPFADAVAARWVSGRLYYYQGGSYMTCGFDPWDGDDRLRAWRGYWLNTLREGLELRIPTP